MMSACRALYEAYQYLDEMFPSSIVRHMTQWLRYMPHIEPELFRPFKTWNAWRLRKNSHLSTTH